jgi:hypothetical protein
MKITENDLPFVHANRSGMGWGREPLRRRTAKEKHPDFLKVLSAFALANIGHGLGDLYCSTGYR